VVDLVFAHCWLQTVIAQVRPNYQGLLGFGTLKIWSVAGRSGLRDAMG